MKYLRLFETLNIESKLGIIQQMQIVQLLISMIVAYEEYGDSISYTKEELDNFIDDYELLKQDWNELGSLVLYDYKYISEQKFADVMDLEVEDGDFWMVFDDFEDVLPNDFEFEAKVLDGRIWEDWNGSGYYDYDIDLSDFSEETLKVIVNYCDKNGCEIDTEDGELLLTKDNMIIKNGNIYVGDENLDEHMKDDGMDELKNEIQFGIADAYDGAEVDDVYDVVKSEFEDVYGKYKWKNVKNNDKEVEKLWIKMDKDLTEIRSSLDDYYNCNGKVDYSTDNEAFGNMFIVLQELEFFEMRKPNYDYLNSYPETKTIDEKVREQIG